MCPWEGITKEEKFPHTQKPSQRRGQGGALEPPREKQQQVLRRQNGENSPEFVVKQHFSAEKQLTCPSRQLGLDAQAQASGVRPQGEDQGWLPSRYSEGTRTTQLRESRENHGLAREARDHCYGNTLTTHSQNAGPYLCQCHRWDESAAVYKGSKDTARARGRGQEANTISTPGVASATKL